MTAKLGGRGGGVKGGGSAVANEPVMLRCLPGMHKVQAVAP
jgi:hypothetical protein